MTIAIHGRPFGEEAFPYIKNLLEVLHTHQVQLVIYAPFLQFLEKKKIIAHKVEVYSDEMPVEKADYLLSIGGDGTFLDSIMHIKDKNTPILGINAGRLGFLATTSKKEIEKDIQALLQGQYDLETRTLVELQSDLGLFQPFNFGLNECTIQKKDTSSMIVLHTYINDKFLNSYWSDGLIISTPTGSTAYALSCGGPIVAPNSKSLIICPISPHNLNVRPLIVSDDSVLSIHVESRSKNFMVSLDSRYKPAPSGSKLTIKKSPLTIKIVRLHTYFFFDTLRQKLNWGLDSRN